MCLSCLCTLGEKFDSIITVVHVVQPYYTIPTIDLHSEVPFLSLNIEEVETLLEFGHPAERILSLAKNDSYDSIVIGSRGLSGISEFLLGSISATASQHSTIPVMIVK